MTGMSKQRFSRPELIGAAAATLGDAEVAAYIADRDSDTARALASTVGRGISVASYGAVGDGTTDDTAAIQSALDAGGDASTITLVPGASYRLTGSLVTHIWQRIEGASAQYGTGSTAPAELIFDVSGSTVGIRARSYTYLKDLLIRGPGDAVGTCVGVQMYDGTSNALSLDNVSVNDWATGADLNGVYYGLFIRPEFRRNATGMRITSSLNISIYNPQINSSRAGGTPGVGIDGAARPLSIFGGSIEQFQSGIKVFHSETLNLFGVYFETTLAAANVRGVDSPSLINTTINAYGCYVYTPNVTTWIEQRGGTGRVLNAHGNSFIAGASSANVTGSAAYRFSAGHGVDISGDNWVRVETALTSYTGFDGGALPYPGVRVEIPIGYAGAFTAPGTVLDGKLPLRPVESKTVTVAGVVIINPAFGNTELTLKANATSMNLESVGIHRQELSLTVIQDATGGRTYAYPSNFRFAGGAAPSNTTANTRTTVSMRYDGVVNRWFEVSRAVAVPTG
jgi:hypothetical protein